MKVIRSVNFVYTLYEDENGRFILDLVLPAATNAWANYEKRIILSGWDKFLIEIFPARADRVARKLIEQEKRRQQKAN